mmetsp:Transcript_8411/g.9507  ORF Transcript_8411/g.9507 Transcript_8411/m.9507 type:complete len:350 (+) Transcript_8411:58-1107(+)
MRRGVREYRRVAKALNKFGFLNEGTRACLRHRIRVGSDGGREIHFDLGQLCTNSAGISILNALSSQIGNTFYRDCLIESLIRLEHHEKQKIERMERDEDESSDRQNRLLQQAVFPLVSQLVDLKSGAHDRVHEVDHGSDRVFVQIDEFLNKQTIFVTSNQEIDSACEVEVGESDELRKCTFHASILAAATRLFDAIRVETPLHSSRAVVLVGHGVGGGIALVLGALLHSASFDVRNVVMVGSPSVVGTITERVVNGINPMRVVIAGDPLPNASLIATDGVPLEHVGEVLTLEDVEIETSFERFSLEHYAALLESLDTPLSYCEGEMSERPSGTPFRKAAVLDNEFVSPL